MPVKAPDSRDFTRFAERLADAARGETLPRFRAGGEIFNKSLERFPTKWDPAFAGHSSLRPASASAGFGRRRPVGREKTRQNKNLEPRPDSIGTQKALAEFDPVTEADRKAEQRLRDMIRAAYPEHGIIGEEFGSEKGGAEWRWVLDPIDGTRAFVCGIASWATLVALEKNTLPIIGIIDQPFTDERWIGAEGETFYRRGERRALCRASGVKRLAEARVSTTDPRRAGYFTPGEAEAFAAVAERARLARFSLDAYAYGLLALGELDLVIESSLKRHDFAALIPVVEGAGGVITDWRGGAPDENARGRIVAAATRELHAAALERLRAV